MGHFDGHHGRHDFEHFTAKDDSDDDPVIENRQQPCCFLHSLSVYKSLKAVSSRFQVILRGSSFSTPRGGLCRKRRPWSKFCVIEDIVVSYTSKVEIPVSRYL